MSRRSEDAMAKTVRDVGWVPECVRDAFSWLPHPLGLIGPGRSRKRPLGFMGQPFEIEQSGGHRCSTCAFAEPPWSQGYGGCSMSWLHDRDGGCQAYIKADDLMAVDQNWGRVCVKPVYETEDGDGAPLYRPSFDELPYWNNGLRWCDLPKSTCNLPSRYYVLLNGLGLPKAGRKQVIHVYDEVVPDERARRFWEWYQRDRAERRPVHQYEMFLPG